MISEESYKLRVTSNRAWDMFIKVTKVTKVLFKYLILVVPSCSFLVDQSVLFPLTGHGLFHTCSPSRIHLLLTHLMPTEVGHEPCLFFYKFSRSKVANGVPLATLLRVCISWNVNFLISHLIVFSSFFDWKLQNIALDIVINILNLMIFLEKPCLILL